MIVIFSTFTADPSQRGQLDAEMAAFLDSPDTERRFAELGGVPLRGAPDAFAAFVQAEIAKWREVIRKEGLQLDAGG